MTVALEVYLDEGGEQGASGYDVADGHAFEAEDLGDLAHHLAPCQHRHQRQHRLCLPICMHTRQ